MQRIFARHCDVRHVDDSVAQAFIATHHSQGELKSQVKRQSVGLYYREDLLAVAQFGQPRTTAMAKKYTRELLRLAFRRHWRVVGGASKLMKFYRNAYTVYDIFTYQDMRGEATDVYAHCGFTLVSQGRKKDYLVAPGKTLDTANRREALGMAYATRYGPDRITGSKLGEVTRPNGRRKSNRDLFVEDLGWHIESTPGDRVWEWIQSNVTFYTYRTTASDSDKYYIGVSHVKIANASESDCLNNDYYGSGEKKSGKNKFQNWKIKHRDSLQKEILGIFTRRREAYSHEAELIGDLWATDPLCLNSSNWSTGANTKRSSAQLKKCTVHGDTLHQGASCLRCSAAKGFEQSDCSIHGRVTFRGTECIPCKVTEQIKKLECSKHGLVLHRGSSCATCSSERIVSKRHCVKHGLVTHVGSKCRVCVNQAASHLRECSKHGLVKHQGETCSKCSNASLVSLLHCPTHGMVKHRGDSCYECTNSRTVVEKKCSIHGVTKHQGDACTRCQYAKQNKMGQCPTHGKTRFLGVSCLRCLSAKQFTMSHCEVHGETKHRSGVCLKCRAAAVYQIRECLKHGQTKHQGETCCRCALPGRPKKSATSHSPKK